jgi:hypothetical protein
MLLEDRWIDLLGKPFDRQLILRISLGATKCRRSRHSILAESSKDRLLGIDPLHLIWSIQDPQQDRCRAAINGDALKGSMAELDAYGLLGRGLDSPLADAHSIGLDNGSAAIGPLADNAPIVGGDLRSESCDTEASASLAAPKRRADNLE